MSVHTLLTCLKEPGNRGIVTAKPWGGGGVWGRVASVRAQQSLGQLGESSGLGAFPRNVYT